MSDLRAGFPHKLRRLPGFIGPNGLRILHAVAEGKRKGMPPSIRDLCELTGTRINNVRQQLGRLRSKGLVAWDDNHARTLTPTFTFTPAAELEGGAS